MNAAPLASVVMPNAVVSECYLINGQWRIAKYGFEKTGKGADDYRTALRLYLPKTREDFITVHKARIKREQSTQLN